MIYEPTYFKPFGGEAALKNISTICIGSGRFLRAVLVPSVQNLGGVVIAQPRGVNFVEKLKKTEGLYELDTVLKNGEVVTDHVKVEATGSLSNQEDLTAFLQLPSTLPSLRMIGIGITEAGFNIENAAITTFTKLLVNIHRAQAMRSQVQHVSVINTDNVYLNGLRLKELVNQKACNYPDDFLKWLELNVTFHNSMVDRITSHRADDELVPRAEPLPAKALVIEDLTNSLPAKLQSTGVLITSKANELEKFISSKLLIANATHSCIVHSMALCGHSGTSACIKDQQFLNLVDGIFQQDILPSFDDKQNALDTYGEWRTRLQHPFFETNTFFVCQNATNKLCIRILPTLIKLVSLDREPSGLLAYSIAVMLRYLTPTASSKNGVFIGKIVKQNGANDSNNKAPKIYASDLTYDLSAGEYQFRNDSDTNFISSLYKISLRYAEDKYEDLLSIQGLLSELFNLKANALEHLTPWLQKISSLYFKILNDESKGTSQYQTLSKAVNNNKWLELNEISQFVKATVEETPVIDLHTHLFPESHGDLNLHGIDELLTYHYLVAEYFMVAPSDIIPEEFFKRSKKEQADLIWNELFIRRSPISEACQGVVTTLKELGLGNFVEAKNLNGIRKWCKKFSPTEYIDMIFKLANVKYCVMTNIPYDEKEQKIWMASMEDSTLRPTNELYKSALRIDRFLQNDWEKTASILNSEGFNETKDGLKCYLKKWIGIMKPEYLMASVPTHFDYPCELNSLDDVILPICKEYNLAVAMKFGAERAINTSLQTAGDGLKVVDLKPLINLCLKNPEVKFLVTFLSRVNQHELCVVANKFRNLHVYGCWWYCNNPSIIKEMTQMRLEILGSGFTAQHSDARVLDQIVYKWKHSRRVIAEVLTEQFTSLFNSGWKFTKSDVERDVWKLFGGAYLEFLQK